MKGIDISIVVPVRNEETQIRPFFVAVSRVLEDACFEVIFIDDGSTDSTWTIVRELREESPRAGGLRLTRNFGKEAAIWSGLEISRGAAVIFMDVDLQHPPSLIPQMIELWKSGRWKIVEACKRRRGREPIWYRVFSKMFYKVLEQGTGFDFVGATDFKLLDRQVIEVLKHLQERVTFFRGICLWTGMERTTIEFEVPSGIRPTRWSLWRLAKLGVDAITSFTPWPLFLVALVGVVFAMFSVLLGIDTLYMYLSGRAVTGFTTVILLVLIVGTVIMFGLGILGLYISRLFDEVKGRPRTIASEQIQSGAVDANDGPA